MFSVALFASFFLLSLNDRVTLCVIGTNKWLSVCCKFTIVWFFSMSINQCISLSQIGQMFLCRGYLVLWILFSDISCSLFLLLLQFLFRIPHTWTLYFQKGRTWRDPPPPSHHSPRNRSSLFKKVRHIKETWTIIPQFSRLIQLDSRGHLKTSEDCVQWSTVSVCML